MKTIFITASIPMTVRNLMRTEVVESLCRDFRVVVLGPYVDDPGFREEFGNKPYLLERLPYPVDMSHSKLAALSAKYGNRMLHSHAMIKRFIRRTKIDTMMYREYLFYEHLKSESMLKYLVNQLRDRLVSNDAIGGFLKSFGSRLQRYAWNTLKDYQSIFEKYKPVATICTHPYLPSEWILLHHAEQRNIPRLAVIHSWDNITSRGELPCRFDKIFVWSEQMRREVLKYYPETKAEDVLAPGAPQHDLFVDTSRIQSRETFFKGLGLDPSRALILFAGQGPAAPYEGESIATIIDAMENGKFSKSAQLWIRFYGDDSFKSIVPKIENRPNVKWEQASGEFWGTFRIQNKWNATSAFNHYLNLLYHSDVVVCNASTVTIDAAVLDRPVINVCYDGSHDLDFYFSIRRLYFDRNHYQRVVRSGGLRVALEEVELVPFINDYLENPDSDRAGRARLVKDICGTVDGRAAKRLSDALITSLKQLT